MHFIPISIFILIILTISQVSQAVSWDPNFCSWEGSVPFCNSDCPGPKGNQVRCTTERRSCSTGNKGLCCQTVLQAQCCRVLNNLHPNEYDTLIEIDPEAAERLHSKCVEMRNHDQNQ